MSAAVNVSTNSPNILHITNGDFLKLNCLHRDQYTCQRVFRSDFNSYSPRLPCYLLMGPLKRDLFKTESKFQKCKKKFRKSFFFLTLLHLNMFQWFVSIKKQYLSSAANVLTNSRNILHITKRDFLQLNCFHSDQ